MSGKVLLKDRNTIFASIIKEKRNELKGNIKGKCILRTSVNSSSFESIQKVSKTVNRTNYQKEFRILIGKIRKRRNQSNTTT